MKHTSAPWRVEKSGYTQIANLVYAGDYPVCSTSVPAKSVEEWESNAKLIAAAPDLLEACKMAFDNLQKGESETKYRLITCLNALEEAIKKATE